ncbi:MAG: ABC transporter permease, partial [Verrucomicrobiales bacterium]|nr:ABC transporter permease [Verrucomicrobiales bacterium]
MNRILGIFILFLVVYFGTWILSDGTGFMSAFNQHNLMKRTAMAGILAIGVSFVIITGGIDLSIGSVVCLVGVGLPYMLIDLGWPVWVALLVVAAVPFLIGAWHGFLITRLNIQPFIATLCGLLIYRGVTRGFTADQSVGYQGEFAMLR